jgi:RNA polymerase sigma-70 factor (ECF subfamily)
MQAAELEAIWSAAREAWPEIAVERGRFARFVEGKIGEALRWSDLYLACACADGDAAALRALDGILDEVGRKLRALAGGDEVLGEAKQIVRQVVLPRDGRPPPIAEYSGRGHGVGDGARRQSLARAPVDAAAVATSRAER